MKLAELCEHLERIAPPALAAEWDNVGLLAGDPAANVRQVLLAVDLTGAVLAEAISLSADLIVCYHPPIFEPVRRLRADSAGPAGQVFEAIRRGVAVYAMHTALDAAPGGTNDVLADVLGLDPARSRPIQPCEPATGYKLVTFAPADAVDVVANALFDAGAGRIGDYARCSFRVAGAGTFEGSAATSPAVGRAGRLERVDEVRLEVVVPTARAAAAVAALRAAHPYEELAFDLYPLARLDERVGLGRVGPLSEPATIDELVDRIKLGLGVEAIWLAAPPEASSRPITIAACGAGSGGSLCGAAVKAGAQFYLTGEVRHHDALAAVDAGLAVAMVRHSVSERKALPRVAEGLAAAGGDVDVRVSGADADPFAWA